MLLSWGWLQIRVGPIAGVPSVSIVFLRQRRDLNLQEDFQVCNYDVLSSFLVIFDQVLLIILGTLNLNPKTPPNPNHPYEAVL